MSALFTQLGMPRFPAVLAPLAGVSDHPFRRICTRHGADLTYVEMISATALLYESKRTYEMLTRHADESVLGVQVTGRSADEVARAIEILDRMPFDTIDINMGCPVRKVVGAGCGSAILKDPARVLETVRLARQATQKPLSAKIRIGWDRTSLNAVEVAQAIQEGGADWMTVHGRTRSDDYGVPVELPMIRLVKESSLIPVLGNGNVFTPPDAAMMATRALTDGVMVSRGALGNPWIFRQIKGDLSPVTLDDWRDTVVTHLVWQRETYGEGGAGAVCMRKHLLWYLKGWPGVKKVREEVNQARDLEVARGVIESFADELARAGIRERLETSDESEGQRFRWDPKYDMDRQLDRGIGDDGLPA